ncbi:hypothetical protein HDU82_004236, partial [Entophlyctis luteolus]
ASIVGYYGSGEAGHPNKGYVLGAPNYLQNITNANFPNSAQTQQIGINDQGITCGFYADNDNNNFGFVFSAGVYTSVMHPDTGNGTVNQLLGLNNGGYAVGFYTDGDGNNHGYSYNIATAAFAGVIPPDSFGCTSTTATSTNDNGDVVGFCDTATNTTISFFANNGQYTMFQAPGSTNTQAFGINVNRDIVGSFVDEAGVTHGFLVVNAEASSPVFLSIDHPSAVNSTILNGINSPRSIVGFYVDANGNTNGMLATAGGSGATSVAPGSGIATANPTSAAISMTTAAGGTTVSSQTVSRIGSPIVSNDATKSLNFWVLAAIFVF